MPKIKILTERELQAQIGLDADAIDCVEQAFATLAKGGVEMPPILRLDIADYNGEVDVKTAYVPGLDSFAIKISPGFFDNPKLGLPSVNGMMVVFSAKTGLVEALLLDNGYLTDVRTAAAGAVAARYLAREDATSVGVLGGGVQARLQLKALTLVRPIERAVIWARDADKRTTVAESLSGEMGIPVTPVDSPQQALAGQDIVVTTTPSTTPLVMADWLEPGQHITAMGSDAEHKNELHPDALGRADRYICDRLSQVSRLGELHHALAAGVFAETDAFLELGQVVAGVQPGRETESQITICDLTGTGVQDTAIATLARERCLAANVGTDIES